MKRNKIERLPLDLMNRIYPFMIEKSLLFNALRNAKKVKKMESALKKIKKSRMDFDIFE